MQDTGDKTNLCHLCHNFFKCPIIVPCLFQNDPKKTHICPIFSPRKSPHFPYFFQNAPWAACHKEINVTCKYKIYAEEN